MFAPQNKPILLVHSDDIVLGGLQEVLGGLGYPVTACREASEVESIASERDFELAAIGLDLSDDLFLRTVLAIRRSKPSLPVVALANPPDLRRALAMLRSGVDDYVLLP